MGPEAQLDIDQMSADLAALQREAEAAIGGASTLEAVEDLRVSYLGKKGKLSQLLRQMGKLPPEQRPQVGQVANKVKAQISGLLEAGQSRIQEEARNAELAERLDVTLPGRGHLRGKLHPLTQTTHDILAVLANLGFELAEGPEIEHDFYNFEALNMPRHHPARDMQDTFYIEDDVLLRTHTSPVQIRAMMASGKAPVRVSCFGRVYRNDDDNTHSPMFHQIEGLYVDERVTFGDLKGTLEVFVQKIFSPNAKIRLRPSFFPFTEPSAEVDLDCFNCGGTGEKEGATCRLCKGTGWIEIMGAGMVDPAVYTAAGLDPDQVSGFAFGIGVERVAMLRYGVTDIRLFFENDQRFLAQF
jgi:phenylalanyl-tRNA synthetase alpha chain